MFLYSAVLLHGYVFQSMLESFFLYVTLEQATKAKMGSRGIAQLYTFFNLGARWEWMVNVTPRPLYPSERDVIFAAHNVPLQFCEEGNMNIVETASYWCVIFSCLIALGVDNKANRRACKLAGLF